MKRKRPDAAIRYSTLCRGAVQYLIDEFTVRKNNNKVLTDKLKVLEDKAEKVETAVSNLARSDRGQTSTPEIINLEGGQDPPTNGTNTTAPITPPVPAPTAPPAPPAKAAPMVAPQSTLTPIRDSKATAIRSSKMARLVHGIQGSGSQKNRTQITN